MPYSKRIRNLPTEHFEFSPAATSSFHVFPRISRPIISKMSSSSGGLVGMIDPVRPEVKAASRNVAVPA